MTWLPLRTPALVLRHFVPDDAAQVLALNDEATTRRWLPSHVYGHLDEAVAAIGRLIAQYAAPGDPRLGAYVLGVEHAASGRLLGHVGFSPFDGAVECSYAIAEAERGRGYGAEALAAACRWAADAFALQRIVAVTAAANVASRRTLERCAFGWLREERRPFQGSEQAVAVYAWPACTA